MNISLPDRKLDQTEHIYDNRYKGIHQEETRNAVNTLEDYFANVDLSVDLNKKEATAETITS